MRRIALTLSALFMTATCLFAQSKHQYVDLGLSVKWATCNIGADKPEDHGDYFSWGETENKRINNWETYRFTEGDKNQISKYCSNSQYGWHELADSLSALEPDDDVAHKKWGGNWRIPTKAEIKELIENCTWTRTTRNNINGYLVTGKKPGYTDRSIFIPVTGTYDDGKLFFSNDQGHYWSRDCGTVYPPDAYTLELSVSEASIGMKSRCESLAVRPVCK